MGARRANGQGTEPEKYRTSDGRARYRAVYSVMVDGHQKRRMVTAATKGDARDKAIEAARATRAPNRGGDGLPDDVVRRIVTADATAHEVRERIAEVVKARNEGRPLFGQSLTFGEFAAFWRERVLPGEGLAPGTVTWYLDMLDRYVLPAIGAKPLTGPGALSVGDIEQMTGDLRTRGLSPRVQRAARVIASKVLHAAERRDLVTRNVARLATAPKNEGRAKPQKALTAAQTAAVLAAVEPGRWYPLVTLAFATGLRPGELLALHWSDLHLDGAEPHLSVRHALTHRPDETQRRTTPSGRRYGPSVASLKAPKRDRSHRTVPIPPEVVPVLKAWRKWQAEERLAAGPGWSTDWPDLVFTTEAGLPQRVDVYRFSVQRLLREHEGLPHFHPHMTRHTYATHLLEAGVPISHVAELLGDTVATVEAAYSHVLRPKHEVTAVVASLFAIGAP
jgi:integrase